MFKLIKTRGSSIRIASFGIGSFTRESLKGVRTAILLTGSLLTSGTLLTGGMLLTGGALLTGCGTETVKSDAYGNFEAVEVVVSAETGGRLLALDAEEGQRLESGYVTGWVDTLALNIQKRQLEAQKAAILSRLQDARAQADIHREQKAVTNIERDRIHRMFEDGSASRRQLDEIEGNIRILTRQIAAAGTRENSIRSEAGVVDAQMEELLDRISRSAVRSPITGTVLTRYAEPGEMVSPGKPVLRVADLGTMYLRAYISGSQLSQVRLGQTVDVLFDGPGGTIDRIDGEISWIASRGEFTPRTIQTREERVNTVYAMKVRVRNDGRLKIGMPGEVRF